MKMEAGPSTSKLYECFKQTVLLREVTLDLSVVKDIIVKDLLIKFDKLSPDLVELLPRMFVVYANYWPGWNKFSDYNSGKLLFSVWYERFKQYLILKLNYIILNEYKEAKKMVNEELIKTTMVDHGTQTDNLAMQSNASFVMKVSCTPEIMNTLVFTTAENSPDDLVMRMHPSTDWNQINFSQLMNWPYVEIIFTSPELKFSRQNVTEYTRYISLTSNPLRHERQEFISCIDLINPGLKRSSYTLKYFEEYIHAYVDTLTKIKNLLRDVIHDETLNDWKIILNNFLLDIKEISLNNSMATNTKVTFNIGQSNYVRVKKFSTRNSKTPVKNDVGYCEYITPKIELALEYFKAVQNKNKEGIHFKYLDELKSKLHLVDVSSVIPQVKYRCNFCNLEFLKHTSIYKHLYTVHKSEQNVVCYRCKRTYSIAQITQCRWDHTCKAAVMDTT